MANNMPLGTYVTDGIRSGPFYSGQLPNTLVGDDNGVILSGSHSAYGPGILFSPQNTYNIKPYVTSTHNVVATTVAANVTGTGYLTLFGDRGATKLVNGTIYFDVPRVVTVTIAGAIAGNRRVTIFGTDYYGMPLQHTYVVDAIATYPIVENEGAANQGLSVASKAFFTVTGVYIDGALGAGSTISLGASDIYGLPYVVGDKGEITSIGWGLNTDLTVPAGGDSIIPLGCFVGASEANSTAITGDVRGLYAPSSAADSDVRLRFTCYLQGADALLNQVANAQELQRQNNLPVIGMPQRPLKSADLYGVRQFYTGKPS